MQAAMKIQLCNCPGGRCPMKWWAEGFCASGLIYEQVIVRGVTVNEVVIPGRVVSGIVVP